MSEIILGVLPAAGGFFFTFHLYFFVFLFHFLHFQAPSTSQILIFRRLRRQKVPIFPLFWEAFGLPKISSFCLTLVPISSFSLTTWRQTNKNYRYRSGCVDQTKWNIQSYVESTLRTDGLTTVSRVFCLFNSFQNAKLRTSQCCNVCHAEFM